MKKLYVKNGSRGRSSVNVKAMRKRQAGRLRPVSMVDVMQFTDGCLLPSVI